MFKHHNKRPLTTAQIAARELFVDRTKAALSEAEKAQQESEAKRDRLRAARLARDAAAKN